MNYIKHLTGFFDRIIADEHLNPSHISLYIALFQFWNINRFQNPISISRDEVMRISKIASKATYHKCMRELNDSGYVKYEPSFNPYRGSMVVLYNFSETPEPYQKKDRSPQPGVSNFGPALNEQRTGSQTAPETASEQALVSSINTTNITNLSNLENVSNLEELPPFFELDDSIFEKQIAASAKEKKLDEKKNPILPPGKEEVQMYFHTQAFPEVEAHKFFNYFSSIGWLVGGKSPMVDWKAAAENWMLNAPKFAPSEAAADRASHLHIGTDKNYGEPL